MQTQKNHLYFLYGVVLMSHKLVSIMFLVQNWKEWHFTVLAELKRLGIYLEMKGVDGVKFAPLTK